MKEPKHSPVLSSLPANLAVFVLLPLALNGVIFGLGWNKSVAPMTGLPPGWAVGTLWLLLFAEMGTARWTLVKADVPTRSRESISVLAFLCLLYPVYTSGFSNEWNGLVGNVVTLTVALPVTWFAWRRVQAVGGMLVPLNVWLAYAAFVTARSVYR